MVFAPAVLAVLSLLLVLFSPPLERLIEQAAEVIKTKNIEVHMELWKGMTSAFWLSLATIALGVLFFVFRKKLLPVLTKINETLFPLAFPDLFIRLLDLFFLFAGRLTPFHPAWLPSPVSADHFPHQQPGTVVFPDALAGQRDFYTIRHIFPADRRGGTPFRRRLPARPLHP